MEYDGLLSRMVSDHIEAVNIVHLLLSPSQINNRLPNKQSTFACFIDLKQHLIVCIGTTALRLKKDMELMGIYFQH